MGIARRLRAGYSIGHFLNDCCASMWFTYLLIFFKKVIHLTNRESAALLLIGQVVDGCFTPVVGILSDRYSLCFYTKRKSWHLFGTILTAISFIFIFSEPVFNINSVLNTTFPTPSPSENNSFINTTLQTTQTSSSFSSKFYYYIPFISIFQIGWASVQISHLALIPFLTTNDKDRADLNSKRYSVLILANTFIYIMAAFQFSRDGGDGTRCSQNLNAESESQFSNLALIAVATGLCCSALFHFMVTEDKPTQDDLPLPEKVIATDEKGEDQAFIDYKTNKQVKLETPLDWLTYLPMYTNAIVYMAARLAANCLQIYLTLYIADTIKLDKKYLGILPFVQYLFGFVASVSTKWIHKSHSTAAAYLLGCALAFAACIWVVILSKQKTGDDGTGTWMVVQVFSIFALYGAGGNMVVCSALGLTAELIGSNTQSSAFVYGLMSFGDKIFNGIAVVILEDLNTCSEDIDAKQCTKPECAFYGNFVSWGTSAILLIGLVFVLIQRYVKH